MNLPFRIVCHIIIVFSFLTFVLTFPLCADATYTEHDKSAEGSMRVLDYNDETRQVLELTDGFLLPWCFSYTVSSEFHYLKVYCERFVGSHEIDNTLLLEREFIESSDNEPHKGEILISGVHRYVSLRDIYFKDMDLVNIEGTVIDTVEGMKVFGWDYKDFPAMRESESQPNIEKALALFPATIPVNNAENTENIYPGERMDLALYIEAPGAEAFNKYSYVEITIGDTITLPEDISDTFVLYVFYCVFE